MAGLHCPFGDLCESNEGQKGLQSVVEDTVVIIEKTNTAQQVWVSRILRMVQKVFWQA